MNDTPTNFVTIGNYRIIRADDRNLQVDEFRTVKAKRGNYVKVARETDKWVRKGYFPNLESAAVGILQYMEADSVTETQDVKSLIGEIRSNARYIENAVSKADLKTEDFVK